MAASQIRVYGDHSQCPRCFPALQEDYVGKSAAKPPYEPFTAERKKELEVWAKNKLVNPATNAKITAKGPTYAQLEKEYNRMQEEADPAARAKREVEEKAALQQLQDAKDEKFLKICQRITETANCWYGSFRMMLTANLVQCSSCHQAIPVSVIRDECKKCTTKGSYDKCSCSTIFTVECGDCHIRCSKSYAGFCAKKQDFLDSLIDDQE